MNYLLIIILILIYKIFLRKVENFALDNETKDYINQAVKDAIKDRSTVLAKDEIKDLIDERYTVDFNAIRSLGDIAYKLQKTGLEIPSSIKVRGDIVYTGAIKKE